MKYFDFVANRRACLWRDVKTILPKPNSNSIARACFIILLCTLMTSANKSLEKKNFLNNWFIRRRTFIEMWSTREVWRARKMHKSCSRRNREQISVLECSPNFPSASYLDERTADAWTNWGSNPVRAWIFFRSYYQLLVSVVFLAARIS